MLLVGGFNYPVKHAPCSQSVKKIIIYPVKPDLFVNSDQCDQ